MVLISAADALLEVPGRVVERERCCLRSLHDLLLGPVSAATAEAPWNVVVVVGGPLAGRGGRAAAARGRVERHRGRALPLAAAVKVGLTLTRMF